MLKGSLQSPVGAVFVGVGVFLSLVVAGVPAGATDVPSGSILVVASHPDDDVLLAAGITSVSSDVTIAYMTNGEGCESLHADNTDYCGVAVPTIGTIRQEEAVAAQVGLLNRVEDDLIFFGYPTYYLDWVYYYTAQGATYTSPTGRSETFASHGLGRTDYHSYWAGSPASYGPENLLADMVHLLTTERPDHIFTMSQYDRHPDHALTYVLTVDALEQVMAADPTYQPTLHSSIVHVIPQAYWGQWPELADPTAYLTPIPELETTTGGLWTWGERESFEVPAAMQDPNLASNVKYQALETHASQNDPNLQDAGYIRRFTHRDEVFWVNRAPVAVDDGPFDAVEGQELVVDAAGVLGNDTDADGDSLTAVEPTDASHGTVTLDGDGSFTYAPDPGFVGPDSFTYRAEDPDGFPSNVAVVTINVAEANDVPVAVDDGPFNVEFGGTLVKAAPGVLGNDTDGDGDVLTAEKVSDPAHGTVTLNTDGSFTYTHNGDTAKTDSFTYQAKDATASSNVATVSLTIGDAPPPVVDGHTTGLVDPSSGKWYLYDDDGTLVASFFYGNPGDYPFMGDWDGDGVETPGLYRQSDGYVYLRNSNTQGVADIKFFFGNPGDVPIAGDFNNDGFDTVSIYRPSNQTFYIINKLGSGDQGLGAADFSYVFGNPGDKPFVGDFNGNGTETVGLHRESTGLVYFRNTHTQGNADAQFIFGDPGDRLIAGDWTDDGTFTPALFRPSNTTMYFRYTNTQGNADNQFIPTPTNPAWLPVSGKTG